jgi:MYXO-CTERM domain-containing protein
VGRFGYQALGFAVWKGAKWYLRRRYGDKPRKLAAAGLAALGLAGALVAQRRSQHG